MRPITKRPGVGRLLDPVWSPDGTRIALRQVSGKFDLFRSAPDSSGLTSLTHTSEADEDWPAWSPEVDARRIAFIRNGHLAVIGQGGTGLRWVTSGDELTASRPSWSADGSRIVFTRDPGSVLLVGLDCSGLVVVLVDGLATGAVWEPP
jgi:TolB protein